MAGGFCDGTRNIGWGLFELENLVVGSVVKVIDVLDDLVETVLLVILGAAVVAFAVVVLWIFICLS